MQKIIRIYNVLGKGGKALRNKINIEIVPWNKCNNNCLMCTNPLSARSKQWFGLGEILRILELKMKVHKNTDTIENISLTGGEPTIAPYFFELLLYLRKRFPGAEVNLLTNGRRLSAGPFAKKCLDYIDKLNIILSLPAHQAGLYHCITQAEDGFKQALEGLKNILAYRNNNQHLEIRIVITKLNYKYLDGISKFLIKNFKAADRMAFIFMDYAGQAKKNLDRIGLRYKDINKETPALKRLAAIVKEIRLYHFPLCVISPDLWQYAWRTLPAAGTSFLEKCNICLYKQYCLGIPKNYIKVNGVEEFNPPGYKYVIKESGNFYNPVSSL